MPTSQAQQSTQRHLSSNVNLSSSLQQQQQQQQSSSSQVPHRTSQSYVPHGDLLPASLSGYPSVYGQMMSSLQEPHRRSLPMQHMLSQARQYSASQQDPQAMYGHNVESAMQGMQTSAGQWARRRMTENVTPANHMSAHINASGHLIPGPPSGLHFAHPGARYVDY